MQFRTKYEGPHLKYEGKVFITPVAEMRYQRPVVKAEKCCHCGWCYLFCPTGCIDDKGAYFAPNLDYCKGCGTCARECPSQAVALVREMEL